jgi:hypothetical protein
MILMNSITLVHKIFQVIFFSIRASIVGALFILEHCISIYINNLQDFKNETKVQIHVCNHFLEKIIQQLSCALLMNQTFQQVFKQRKISSWIKSKPLQHLLAL